MAGSKSACRAFCVCASAIWIFSSRPRSSRASAADNAAGGTVGASGSDGGVRSISSAAIRSSHWSKSANTRAFPRPSNAKMRWLTRSNKYRSWVTNTSAPAKSIRLVSSTSREFKSKSFVGSSNSSTSAGRNMSRAIITRDCSPPDSRPRGASNCSLPKRNRSAQPTTWTGLSL